MVVGTTGFGTSVGASVGGTCVGAACIGAGDCGAQAVVSSIAAILALLKPSASIRSMNWRRVNIDIPLIQVYAMYSF